MSFIFRKLQLAILSVIMVFTSIFNTGAMGKTYVEMPPEEVGEYTQYVEAFSGTGGYPWVAAMLNPAACVPFSSVNLGPDTCGVGGLDLINMGNSGYLYSHNYLLGFSHTRLAGTGANDRGFFRVTPAAGNSDPAKRLKNPLLFLHESETASPGYYAVNLPTIGCMAELTATVRGAVHKYTFSSDRDAHLWIDATSSFIKGGANGGKITVDTANNMIYGEGRVLKGEDDLLSGVKAYFVAHFNQPIESFSTWIDGKSEKNRAEASGDDTGVNLNFGDIKGKPLEMQFAMSYVSVQNALLNLETEIADADFAEIRTRAVDEWENILSKISVETADETVKKLFYTSLYHTMLTPTNFTDVNGDYLGFGEKVGNTGGGFEYFTDLSLWDTYRTLHPLLTLFAPDKQLDMAKSLLLMGEADSGALPRWPVNTSDSGSMFGSPANMVLAESYLKGLEGFTYEDALKAYEYMKNDSDNVIATGANGRRQVEYYNSLGYVPAYETSKSVSYTLEYAWADYSLALLGEKLGMPKAETDKYLAKSENYRTLFNNDSKYFQPRDKDGNWVKIYPNMTSYYADVFGDKLAEGYCEGSARQWRWSVPQNPSGLIELFGSKDYFISELETFIKDSKTTLPSLDPGAGYWHGNEHDIHAIYLFNDAGRPDLAQKYVRWALEDRYTLETAGLDGNDDGGTLSAWYVLSAMGIYPVAGTDRYWFGSPVVDNAVIDLGGGKTLTISAENQSEKNVYVKSVSVNGVDMNPAEYLYHSQIKDGGTIEFVMSDTPIRR